MAKRKAKRKVERTHDSIVARSIRIVDDEGNVRMNLGATATGPGLCGVQIMGRTGLPLIDLQVTDFGEATLSFTGPDNQTAISIGINQSSHGMSVTTKDGTPVLYFGVDLTKSGPFSPSQGYLFIRNAETNEQVILPDPNEGSTK